MSIFLKKVAISEFRPYGAFAIDLPGPGVTMLVGPNGLGKTAFFEALEWGLTGRVQRLEELPKERARGRSYIGRMLPNGRGVVECKVTLEFSDDSRVARSLSHDVEQAVDQSSGTVNVSPHSSVADVLKAQDWPLPVSPESLPNYLRSTHFLGQAASLRLTGQDPRERWTKLSQLNGAEFVSRVQAQLMTRATTTALRRANERAQSELAQREQARELWDKLLDRREELRKQAGIGGAIPRAEVLARATSLPQVLRKFAPREAADDAGKAIDWARTAIVNADAQLAASLARLDGLHTLIAQWSEQHQRRSELYAELGTGTALVEQRRAEYEVARQVCDAARNATVAADQAKLEADALETLMFQVSDALVAMATLQLEETRLSVEAEQLESRFQELRQKREVAMQRQTLTARRASLLSVRQELESLRRRDEEIAARTQALAAAESEREQWVTSLNAIGAQTEVTTASLDEARRFAARAASSVTALQQRGTALSAALATIAALLGEDDHNCPVCRTQFTGTELLRRAKEASESGSPALTAAEEDRQVRAIAEREVAVELSRLQDESRRLRNLLRERDQQRQALDAERSALAAAAGLQGIISSELEQELTRRTSELTAQLQAVDAALVGYGPPDETSNADASEVENVREQIVSTSDQQVALGKRRRELLVLIDGHPELAARVRSLTPDGVVREAGDLRASRLEALRLSAESLSRAEAALTGVEAAVKHAEAAVASSNAGLNSCARTMQTLQGRWRDAGFEGEPVGQVLEAAIRRILEEQSEAASWREVVSRLADGLLVTEASESLARVDNEVAVQLARERCGSEQELSRAFRGRVEQAKGAIAKAVQVGGAIDRVRQLFSEVSESYYQEVLAPLNVLERRFARALTVRTAFEVELSQRTSRGATLLDLTSRFDGRADSPALSAVHLLSEGQLAATAFTQVASMSTAYRWSSWPALLLDDPVQHNDVLHVSAFVDVIRNLVRQLNYQVIISTHDPEIAGFISRKLRSAGGIEQQTCWFEGLGESGVKYRVR